MLDFVGQRRRLGASLHLAQQTDSPECLMLAMQYSIQLPDNYDVARIRERVNARKSLFDEHEGLTHKSFLYNDADKLYAPFYIWDNVGEAQQFLLNDLFKGVIDTFSRCRVRTWFSTHMSYGNRGLVPTYALREVDVIPPEEQLDQFLLQEKAEQDALLADPNLYLHVVAFDAERWEILKFSLWRDKASAQKPGSDSYLEYDVLHVSDPKG
jgi:hypothetical protein